MRKYRFLELLDQKNISQRELAIYSKLNKNTTNNYINNKSDIPSQVIVDWCHILELNDPVEIVDIFLPDVYQNDTE
jgi:transcriptional regulator with XRE-family HTH domain